MFAKGKKFSRFEVNRNLSIDSCEKLNTCETSCNLLGVIDCGIITVANFRRYILKLFVVAFIVDKLDKFELTAKRENQINDLVFQHY